MLSKLTSNQKILLIVSGVMLFMGLLIISIVVLILNVRPAEETVTEPLLTIEYCGTQLEQICILSFGRDQSGDTIINLFIPNELSDFYLKVSKLSGEVIYECEKNEDVETSVYCVGEAILLGEQIEIVILSKKDDMPFAAGEFTLTAILISSQMQDSSSPPSRTATPAFATQPVSTPETESPTPTPEVSYPNYP